jgi:sulfoquinovosidase
MKLRLRSGTFALVSASLTLLLLPAAACSDDGRSSEDDPKRTNVTAGGVQAFFDPPEGLVTFNGEFTSTALVELLPFAAASDDPKAVPTVGFASRKASAKVAMNFGAYKFEETADAPWIGATKLLSASADLDSGTFQLQSAAGNIDGTFSKLGNNGVGVEVTAPKGHNRLSIAWKCHTGEHFIGLGGQSWDVDHRGQSVPLWVTEDGLGKHPDDKHRGDWTLVGKRHDTHTPIPIAISSRGYAVAIETTAFTTFHLCSEKDDMVRVEVWDKELKLRVFGGAKPADVIKKLTAWTGRPKVPAPFAFGLWLDALYGSKNVRRIAKKLREVKSLAVAIWSEDWRGGDHGGTAYTLHEDWNVDRKLYPDFEEVDEDLEKQGFKWLTYNNTFITETGDIYKEAIDNKYTIQSPKGGPYLFKMHKLEDASLLDFTNPAAVAWAKKVYQGGLDIGADGWMADFCEWLPPDAVLHDGSDAMLHHNAYPVAYQKFNRELFDAQHAKDGKDRAWFVRSAWLGSQKYVDVVWAGDQQTDWSAGDGMRSVIPMGLGLGVVGFPYYGHDIGGYADLFAEGATTKELFFRWVTLGAFSPVMRTHHGRNAAANWHWEKDASSTEHIARWGRLHGRLYPVLRRAAERAHESGLPMMRPLAIDHPTFEPGWSMTDQYMLASLYVSPIVDKGATSRTIQLPKGTYRPLLGGDSLLSDGEKPLTVEAEMAEIPVHVRAGAVLVLLPDTVQTLSDEHAKDIVGLQQVGDDREVWLYIGGDSTFTEAGGKLSYQWSGTQLNEVKRGGAKWNGEPISYGADGKMHVAGNGKLELDAATLVVKGGEANRKLTIQVR